MSPPSPDGKPRGWRTRQAVNLDSASLAALFNNDIPAVRIRAFASTPECTGLIDVLDGLEFGRTHFNPCTVQRIGPSYFGFKDRKSAYFRAVREYEDVWRRITTQGIDPVTRLSDLMRGAGVALRRAYEPAYGRYAPAFIKKRTGSQLLHTDTATMMDGWLLGKNTSQLAWNLYLQVSEGRDSTVVYNRGEKQGDERHESDTAGYYTEDVAKDAESVTVWPEVGDVFVFNSYNYHRVRCGATTRITIGGFIGQSSDGEVVHWA